jgi:hypothetical protein
MRDLRATAVLLALVAAFAAGCGGGDGDGEGSGDGSEEGRIRAAATEFTRAFGSGDEARACRLMTEEAKAGLIGAGEELGTTTCEDTMAAARRFVDQGVLERFADAKVRGVQVDGERALATMTANVAVDDAPTQLARVGGDWRVDVVPAVSAQTASTEARTEQSGAAGLPPVEVVKSGFTQKGRDITFGVVLRNGSATEGAADVEIVTTVVDEGGKLLARNTQTVGIPPGSRFYVGDELPLERVDRAARLDIDVRVGRKQDGLALPDVSGAVIKPDPLGGYVVRANATNTLGQPLASTSDVFALLTDAEGQVIGGLHAFPDEDTPPGGSTGLQLNGRVPLENAEGVRVSVDADPVIG